MFDAKWVHGQSGEGETILGSSDIQPLADLNNSSTTVRGMRTMPVDKHRLISFGYGGCFADGTRADSGYTG